MSRQDDIRNLIRRHHRRLQLLKEQQASFGSLHVPVHILTEIEDTEAEIHELQVELQEIESDTDTLQQRIEQQRQRIAAGLAEIRQQAAEGKLPSSEQRRVPVIGRPPLGVVTHFKNRIREQEKIGQLLAEPTTRLVSVIGHGGMGKTALVSKVLRDLEQHHWPHTADDLPLDGIVYLSTRTAGISLERLFLDCAKMLGGEPEQQLNAIWTNPKLNTADKISHLLETLKDGQYVILLDNLEDLLDDEGRLAAEDLQLFFDQSLTTAHGTRLLVTSRIALAFRREVMRLDQQVKLLEGLPITDGVALLRELDPNGDYGLRDAPEEQLAQAVAMVHGVPRALEVIAGILSNDPFATLVEVIEQFYGHEDVVQGLIKENYKRLDDKVKRVIEALAVFRRPVSSLAVDYLLEPFIPGLDVPDIIRRLTHTNIVSVDRATKTIVLHPIDQDYAYSQLSEEGTSGLLYTRCVLERRAADYYLQLRTPSETWKTVDDLEPQLTEFDHRVRAGNYDEACWLLDSVDYDYLFLWGYYAHLIEMRTNLLGRLTDHRSQVINLDRLGNAYYLLGQVEQSIKFYNQALTIARQLSDRQGEGICLGDIGDFYYGLAQFDRAIEHYQQALGINREIGDQRREGIQIGRLGRTYHRLGQFEQALRFYQTSLNIAHTTSNWRNEEENLDNMGRLYRALGKADQAIQFHQEALTIARGTHNRPGEGHHLGRLGVAYRDLGQLQLAVECFERALSIAREVGNPWNKARHLGDLGSIYRRLGEIQRAIECHEQSLAITREIKDHRDEGMWLNSIAQEYVLQEQFGKANEFYNEALLIAQETKDLERESFALFGLGRLNLVEGELEKAKQFLTNALSLNAIRIVYQAALALGIVLLQRHDASARETFADAITRCQALLDETPSMYSPHYTLATALVGQAICEPRWAEKNMRADLLAPALTEYHQSLEICNAPGVVQDALRDLELIRKAGVEGLEPVFELLQAKQSRNDYGEKDNHPDQTPTLA